MTDGKLFLRERYTEFDANRNVRISMTTVAEVSAKGFWRDFVYMHYDIKTQSRPNTPGWLQCAEKTKVSSCF